MGFLQVTAILVLVVCSLQADACDTGRVFLGSINETYPQHLLKNGIYLLEHHDESGYPVYKHESRDLYLYHVTGNLVASFWVVGESPGSLMVSVSVLTEAQNPEEAPEVWRIWNDAASGWVDERHLHVKCVDDTFMTCTTGRLRMHGLSPWNRHQSNRTGTYVLTNSSHSARPVYQHEYGNDYLYYVNGLWIVGPEVGRIVAGMFVLDYAWRPEHILEEWVIFNGRQFLRDTRLKLTCAGEDMPSQAFVDSDDDIDATDVIMIAEGMLGGDAGDAQFICDDSWCQNGGTCIQNEVGQFLCACQDDFFGSRCDQTTSCGEPSPITDGHVISHTGTNKHDVVFYACADDYFLVGDRTSVCEHGGIWSDPPQCMNWLEYIDPGLPAPHARRGLTRRNNRQRHRWTRSTLMRALQRP